MRAAVIETIPSEHLVNADVADPRPAPGELLMAVSRCGVCGTDLHILEGRAYRPQLPFVMGHEPVGTVIAAGSPRDEGWLGRRVVPSLFTGDGTCALCRAGDERLCRELVSIHGVLAAWGGFAERMVIRTEQAVAVPDDIDDDAAATLVDAGASAANSVRKAELRTGERVVVVGGGPLGFLAAELARADGADVRVVQPSATRREMIVTQGYEVVPSIASISDEVDVVIDAAGAPDVLPWSLDVLAPEGRHIAAAYGPVADFDLTPASRKELVIRGVRSGRRSDLEDILGRVARGDIRLPPISTWPLVELDDAIAALRAKAVPGKAVIAIDA